MRLPSSGSGESSLMSVPLNNQAEPATVSPSPNWQRPRPGSVAAKRAGITLKPDQRRVLIRPLRLDNEARSMKICARVMALPPAEVRDLLEQVLAEFGDRHQQMRYLLEKRFREVKAFL